MNKESWQKINALLNEVYELEVSQRRKFIKEINSDELRGEVESLLKFENEADDFLETAALNLSAEFFYEDTAFESLAGKIIGNYRIISELGRGGMGAVYLAERADGKFSQQVALKLLRRELNNLEIRRRFRLERQILAKLQHQNIARLLDAGTTSDNIPFLAMEYIEGEPIDDFFHKNNLDLKEKLEIFRRVCDAVAFAHRQLVVHRDLKPSNILITKDGIPKLLDFGISKLLTPDFESESPHTVTKLGAMTPEYASPEQLRGESVSTSTDIYSLGVILFELLTNHRPFENEANSAKLIRAIIENDPVSPSSVVKNLQAEKNTNHNQKPETYFPTPSVKPQSLRGDIDNIVLMALKKEPERRYSSVEQFAEDIRRHLEGLPVQARPDTITYRTSKFVSRHKYGVIAGLLIFITLIGGITATLWQAKRAERRFEYVRALANSFLFEINPAIENLPGSTRARNLLVKRGLEYLDKLSQESAGDAQLQQELALAYQKVGDVQGNPYQPNLGDMQGALESYGKARTIWEKLIKENPNDDELKADLAKNFQLSGDVYFWISTIEKAEESYNHAFELRENLLNKNPSDSKARFEYASVLLSVGSIPFWNGENQAALSKFESAREIFEKLHDEQPDDTEISNQLGNAYRVTGDVLAWDDKPEEANTYFQKSLSILEPLAANNSNNGKVEQNLMQSHLLFGENLAWEEKWEDAFLHLNEAIELAEKITKNDPNNFKAKRDMSIGYNKLADAYDLKKEGKKAIEYYQKALEIQQSINAENSGSEKIQLDIANTYVRIGDANLTLKNYNAALESYKKSLEMSEKLYAFDTQNSKTRRNIAVLNENIGKTYLEIAKSGGKPDQWRNAHDYFVKSRDIFNEMKNAGTLQKFDKNIVEEVEKAIVLCESKIKTDGA